MRGAGDGLARHPERCQVQTVDERPFSPVVFQYMYFNPRRAGPVVVSHLPGGLATAPATTVGVTVCG
jgi:hypothetical protein